MDQVTMVIVVLVEIEQSVFVIVYEMAKKIGGGGLVFVELGEEDFAQDDSDNSFVQGLGGALEHGEFRALEIEFEEINLSDGMLSEKGVESLAFDLGFSGSGEEVAVEFVSLRSGS